MMRHRNIQQSLFEYAKNELPDAQASLVREHLAVCPDCARSVEHYLLSLNRLGSTLAQPADALPPGYWNSFSASVMQEIEAGPSRSPVADGWWYDFVQVFDLRPRIYIAALGGAVALLLATVVVWKSFLTSSPEVAAPAIVENIQTESETEATLITGRVNQYFRKSRLLLVGLSNMESGVHQPADLSVEQSASRELVREARFLRSSRLDPRSARLVGDIERIFIELANAEGQTQPPTIEMIRTGIRRENLLFKVRMAESMSDSTLLAYAQNRYQE